LTLKIENDKLILCKNIVKIYIKSISTLVILQLIFLRIRK